MKYILKEITPLGKNDLFIANYWPDNQMDFPLHFHEDYELNLTLNVRGKRILGNLVEDFTEKDLVITTPNVLHCYKRDDAFLNTRCEVVVIQFPKELPSWGIFDTDQLRDIRNMLCQPAPGLKFSEETAEAVRERLLRLPTVEGFEGVQLFLDILHELACADRTQVELIGVQSSDSSFPHSRRINRIVQFVEKNYNRKISLEDVGELVGMSASSVSRFFKKRTRHNFWDYLNGFRIDRAAQMMIETEHTISEISYACGFNNISNFNRVFRERIGTTPSDYRNKFKESIIPDR
ncbi:AraC family transcriptional regulator [uncultured Alistipes sp.]|jgi:AraC-like DNA-binding protein|uniref:helix-turn-helix domain-containing protein n=1 Tax=Alistipes sp. TaxID=1872444 RepID=UPI0025F8778F|nr:AraC family transcriptional regulator [uncultured Alistipes sp.]